MPEFKVGDRVYCPADGVGIFVVEIHNHKTYPIIVNGASLKLDGRVVQESNLPYIFHATPENQAALETLYGVKFEDAPKPAPVGSDLTRWLLAKYGKPVLCYVSDVSDSNAINIARLRAITGCAGNSLGFVVVGAGGSSDWRFAVPVLDPTCVTTAADYAD